MRCFCFPVDAEEEEGLRSDSTTCQISMRQKSKPMRLKTPGTRGHRGRPPSIWRPKRSRRSAWRRPEPRGPRRSRARHYPGTAMGWPRFSEGDELINDAGIRSRFSSAADGDQVDISTQFISCLRRMILRTFLTRSLAFSGGTPSAHRQVLMSARMERNLRLFLFCVFSTQAILITCVR